LCAPSQLRFRADQSFFVFYYKGVFTTIDPPGSLGSEVTTIDNNGVIVGDSVGTDGVQHGFIGTPKR
jgi:hypothetical protein